MPLLQPQSGLSVRNDEQKASDLGCGTYRASARTGGRGALWGSMVECSFRSLLWGSPGEGRVLECDPKMKAPWGIAQTHL